MQFSVFNYRYSQSFKSETNYQPTPAVTLLFERRQAILNTLLTIYKRKERFREYAPLDWPATCEAYSFPYSKGPGKRGHIVADTKVSPFARAQHLLRTQKMFLILFRNICVRNKCFPVCAAQETSWATMCPQQCVLVCQYLKSGMFFIFADFCPRNHSPEYLPCSHIIHTEISPTFTSFF